MLGKQVRDLRHTVTTVWFDSTGTEIRRRPRRVWGKKDPLPARIERTEPEGAYVQAHDGRGNAWATLDGVLLSDTARRRARCAIRCPLKAYSVWIRLGQLPRSGVAGSAVAHELTPTVASRGEVTLLIQLVQKAVQ